MSPTARDPADAIAATRRAIETTLPALGGTSTPEARVARKAWSRALRRSKPRAVVALAREVLAIGGAYARMTAYELVLDHPGAIESLTPRDLAAFGRGMASWQAVDLFGCAIAGQAWRAGRLSDSEIARWTASPDRWRRRAALVATVPLNVAAQGGTGDATRTLAVCTRLLDDRDDMVVKALSWALRALARRDRAAVERFLAKHGDRVAARARREVGNLLRVGTKSGRRPRQRR